MRLVLFLVGATIWAAPPPPSPVPPVSRLPVPVSPPLSSVTLPLTGSKWQLYDLGATDTCGMSVCGPGHHRNQRQRDILQPPRGPGRTAGRQPEQSDFSLEPA